MLRCSTWRPLTPIPKTPLHCISLCKVTPVILHGVVSPDLHLRVQARRLYRGTSLIRNIFLLGPCLGPCGGPRGVEVLDERGTPAAFSFVLRGRLNARPFEAQSKTQFWKIVSTFGDECPQNCSQMEPISRKRNPGITLEWPSVIAASQTSLKLRAPLKLRVPLKLRAPLRARGSRAVKLT